MNNFKSEDLNSQTNHFQKSMKRKNDYDKEEPWNQSILFHISKNYGQLWFRARILKATIPTCLFRRFWRNTNAKNIHSIAGSSVTCMKSLTVPNSRKYEPVKLQDLSACLYRARLNNTLHSVLSKKNKKYQRFCRKIWQKVSELQEIFGGNSKKQNNMKNVGIYFSQVWF